MLSAARAAGRGVLDSVWVDRDRASGEIEGLQAIGEVVEVFCRCDPRLASDRAKARILRRNPAAARASSNRPRKLAFFAVIISPSPLARQHHGNIPRRQNG